MTIERKLHLVTMLLAALTFTGCDALNGDGEKADKDPDSEDDGEKSSKKKKKGDDDDDEKPKKKSKQSKKKAKKIAADDGSDDDDDDDENAAGAVTRPDQQSYPLDAVKTIAEDCSSPYVIMATAPESVGADYEWTWTRQTMLANQQFKVVRTAPTAVGQVAFEVHQASDRFRNAWVLVAHCHDGGTCNHLAAMYKAVVKTSNPQAVCGRTLPMDLGPATRKRPNIRMGGDGKNSLPAKTDIIGKCARLNACMIADDPKLTGNPGLDCQKRPSDFKTDCARNYPCAEVKACLDR